MITGRSLWLSACLIALVMLALIPTAYGQADVCVPAPFLSAAEIFTVECEAYFEEAQEKLRQNFEAISAVDTCTDEDLTDRIRVKEIRFVRNNRRYFVPLDIERIADKLEAFEENEYDYTVQKTQKLFQQYLVFKPGIYEIYYHILDDDGVPIDAFRAQRKQVIEISSECKGCLGCLRGFPGCSVSSCIRDPYVPGYADDLKSLLSDWLLIGLSALVMLSWSSVRGRTR